MRVLVFCFAVFLLGGCATSSRHEGGSLSSAMNAAASGDRSSVSHYSRRESGDHNDYGSDVAEDLLSSVINGIFSGIAEARSDEQPAAVPSGGEAPINDQDAGITWTVPMDVSYIMPLNGPIDSIMRYNLAPLTFEGRRNAAGLYVAGGTVEMKPGSLPDRAIRDSWMIETGVAYRHYFNDPHTFFSPYLTGSVGYQLFSWNYRNPVYVNNGVIWSDNLGGVTGYVGAGVAVWRHLPVSLFGEAGFGGTAFVGPTGRGFHNDVFDNFGYFQVKAGLTVKF